MVLVPISPTSPPRSESSLPSCAVDRHEMATEAGLGATRCLALPCAHLPWSLPSFDNGVNHGTRTTGGVLDPRSSTLGWNETIIQVSSQRRLELLVPARLSLFPFAPVGPHCPMDRRLGRRESQGGGDLVGMGAKRPRPVEATDREETGLKS